MQLSTYTTQVRRLIHDANAQFWAAQEITDDINLACQKVVADTACLRGLVTTIPTDTISNATWTSGVATITIGAHTIQVGDVIAVAGVNPSGYNGTFTVSAVTGTTVSYALASNPGSYNSGGTLIADYSTTYTQEQYPFPVVPISANGTSYNQPGMDVLNVSILQGSIRYVMRYLPFTIFNARMRSMVNFYSLPRYYTVTGQNTFWLAPIPDQAYLMEVDTVYTPPTLVQTTDDDTIAYPFTEAVPYYAAYLAFMARRRQDNADDMLELYQKRTTEILHSANRRRVLAPQR